MLAWRGAHSPIMEEGDTKSQHESGWVPGASMEGSRHKVTVSGQGGTISRSYLRNYWELVASGRESVIF